MSQIKAPLQSMFDAVPDRYDLLNRLFTFGFDEKWRKQTAQAIANTSPSAILEIGCGTGDLTLHISKILGTQATDYKALDYAPAMITAAKSKLEKYGLEKKVTFIEGNAAQLPLEDNTIDTIAIAFAFRNLTWNNPLTKPFLSEVFRVLKPGGNFHIVETSQPKNWLWRKGFHLFLKYVVSPFGRLLSNHKSAYTYLAKSAIAYYSAEQVVQLLKEANFSQVTYQSKLGGIAAIHLAVK